MKKVLVFGMTQNPGGVESVIMNYYRNIDRAQIQFDFLANTKDVAYEQEILSLGGKIFRITPRRKNIFKFHNQLKSIFKETHYDAIWVNVCDLANITYLVYAKKYGVKVRIIHSHNSKNMTNSFRYMLHKINKHFIKKYATDFWACSDLAGKFFYSNNILTSDKYRVINNAINLEKYAFNPSIRDDMRKALNLTNNFVVGHIGRLHFQKNQEFLIKVFAEIKKQEKSAVLLLVGQGEDEQKLKAQVNSLNLSESVKFLGVRNDVDKLLQAFDVLVFPSIFEGLPVVLIEAQANGLPIYASDTITSDSKINDNLFFCSLNDTPKQWAEKIIKNNNLARQCNKDGFKKCGFDIKVESNHFLDLFKGEN